MTLSAIIMAGGLGTRLWPLTASGLSKALLSFDSTGVSLLQRTIERLSPLVAPENIFIVAGRSHGDKLRSQTKDIPDENIILEPVARGTLACIGLASLYVKRRDASSIIIALPGEQLVKDGARFRKLVIGAAESAKEHNCVVTLGINPVFPATGFGYIQLNDEISFRDDVRIYRSGGFTEKPDKQRALEFLSSGKYLWNSGIYILPVLLLFENLRKFAPDIHEGLSVIEGSIGTPKEKEIIDQVYPNMRSISIDYGIMEKVENMLVIPADIGWNDMGTWTEVSQTWDKDDHSNSYFGQHVGIDSTGCIIYSPEKLVATIGVHDLIIIDTPDGLLLCRKDRADDVKAIVQKINQKI